MRKIIIKLTNFLSILDDPAVMVQSLYELLDNVVFLLGYGIGIISCHNTKVEKIVRSFFEGMFKSIRQNRGAIKYGVC